MEQEINFMDRLETNKQDTELIIQELNITACKIENMRDDEKNQDIRLKLNAFVNEINKDIEWNEQILQELTESIYFEEQRGNY